MESLITVIDPIFDANQWQMYKSENAIYFRNQNDEFKIAMLPKTAEYEITIPLQEVLYKNKFYQLDTVVDYMKMHLNYYQAKQ